MLYFSPHFSPHYFVQCIMHMTISIVIILVTVSVVAMYVSVLSSNFIFLSLVPTFQKIGKKLKALYQVCISPLL